MDPFVQTLTFFAESSRALGHAPPPGYAYANLYEYVLKNGRLMESRSPTAEQIKYLQNLTRGSSFPLKQCFSNSQILAIKANDDGRLAYYEGYASAGTLPVLHGWLLLDGEVLVDLTWRRDGNLTRVRGPLHRTRVVGEIPQNLSYYGLQAATRSEIVKQTVKTGMWMTFLDDWENDYPRLRTPKAA